MRRAIAVIDDMDEIKFRARRTVRWKEDMTIQESIRIVAGSMSER